VLLAGTIAISAELYFDHIRNYDYVWDVGLVTGLKMGSIDDVGDGSLDSVAGLVGSTL
jgi:hypothetical protein